MKDIIKTILYEWQEQKLPEAIERDVNLDNYLDLKVKKIIALTGFRRVGKTYILFGLIKKLLKEKTRKQVLYINFEDERIPQNTEFLTQLLPTIQEIFGEMPQYIFLDEIQNIPNWSRWLRRVFDKEDIKFFVTGSSSKLSSQEIPTELRGRCLEKRTYPISFQELLRFKNIHLDTQAIIYDENLKAKLIFELRQYLVSGGLPEVVLIEDEIKKRELIQQYFSSILRKDIIERFKVKNEIGLKTLCQFILNSPLFSISRVYSNFKSMNLKIGKTTLANYISHIENSYFLKSVPIFSYKIKDQLQYPRKAYIIDNGFITFLSLKFSKDYGRLLENLVFWELIRRLPEAEIFYWKNIAHKEVDFVIKNGEKIQSLIQVCYDLSGSETKKREINSLVAASKELNVKDLSIINFGEEGQEKVKGQIIKIVPVWKWILGIE